MLTNLLYKMVFEQLGILSPTRGGGKNSMENQINKEKVGPRKSTQEHTSFS